MFISELDGEPVVCGGKNEWRDTCVKMDLATMQWANLGDSLSVKRAYAMVVQLTEDSFWILGTYSIYNF